MNDPKWYKPMTIKACTDENPKTKHIVKTIGIDNAYRHSLKMIATAQKQQNSHGGRINDLSAYEGLCEIVWMKTGQPTWFIDQDMAELLMTAKVDDDISGIQIPYDSMFFCFEHGMKIGNTPLRSINLWAGRSEQTKGILDRFLFHDRHGEFEGIKTAQKLITDIQEAREVFSGQVFGPLFNDRLTFWVDCGQNMTTKVCDDSTPFHQTFNWFCHRTYAEPPNKFLDDSSRENQETIFAAMRLAVGALMYYAARPERIVKYALPRSQRYEFHGERENFKRLVLPSAVKVVRTGESPQYDQSGRVMKPHYRGYVYRCLRAERYKRNPDGTIRVIEVAPCAIHPELMEETT